MKLAFLAGERVARIKPAKLMLAPGVLLCMHSSSQPIAACVTDDSSTPSTWIDGRALAKKAIAAGMCAAGM